MREVRYEIAARKIKVKRSFSRPRRRYNNNNKMNRRCKDIDWVSLAEDNIEYWALVNTAVIKLAIHKNVEFYDQLNQCQFSCI